MFEILFEGDSESLMVLIDRYSFVSGDGNSSQNSRLKLVERI